MTTEFTNVCCSNVDVGLHTLTGSICYTVPTHSAELGVSEKPMDPLNHSVGDWFSKSLLWWAFCHTGWKPVTFWSVRMCACNFITLGENMLKMVLPPFSSFWSLMLQGTAKESTSLVSTWRKWQPKLRYILNLELWAHKKSWPSKT